MEILRKVLFFVLFTLPAFTYAGDAVNINKADKETLMLVKGIGEKRAEAIIAYREQHGPFKSVDQLTEVQGIGSSFIELNQEILTIKDSQ